ncbi:uncharacterized protein PAC_09720 [Phialocephala subalpina]|uniref:Heterokaryon incompatibility domain-containing protein n=1 Tax=Phialocephala subalpina TaxID=576137 RepID=A0A1L7X477_9HELO|nr:uncharacterized protein PAC_09720 [Phialocephala subalpina]
MWLLSTTTLQLEYVNSSKEHSYAILSHTWEDEEVTLQEMAHLDQARRKKGFSKIEWTCRLALERGIQYAWVDTCCIDKSSSAELTEAINSMFKWYKDSTVCFAFLSDLPPSDPMSKTKKLPTDEFRRCRWFTRGWILQELIAPEAIEFYDQSWTLRGDKSSSKPQLFEITGIDSEVLVDSDKLSTIPVARRMSWVSMRQTTRVEDLAYCLFGIFDVNLPLIYGEGLKAFIRLQEGIHGDQQFRGIFARSPYEFRNCGSLVMVANPCLQTTQFEMTHRGINFTTSLINLEGDEKEYYLLNLNCRHSGVSRCDEIHGAIVIPLVRIRNGYVRYHSRTLAVVSLLPFMTYEYDASRRSHRNATQIHIPKMISWAASDLIAVRRAHRFTYLGFGLSPQDRGRASQFRKRAEQLPTTLNLTQPYIQQTRSHTAEARRYSKGHSLLLSVTTNILPHRESGMYELVLSIKGERVTSGPIHFGAASCPLTAHTPKTPATSVPPRPLKLPEEQQTSTRHGLLSFLGIELPFR